MSDFLFEPTPHKEAMEFISGKTIVSREVFAELLPELRARAFTIAGVTSFDVLQRVREELATLPAGGDWNQIKKSVVEEIHPFLADPEDPENTDAAERRAETLLKTHGFQAYSAASYKVMDRQRAVFPFWQYHSMGDGHVRPTHGALNGIVLPANSPFWKGHFPPWEWGCRCQVIPLMQEEVDAMKEKEADQPVEKREVLEGVPLRQLEDHHRLTRGPDQVWDVRTAAEKGDHKGLRWNPDDLRITPQMLEGRYDPVVWATFERWARGTRVHGETDLSVWDWMGGKKTTPIESLPLKALNFPSDTAAQSWADSAMNPRQLGLSLKEMLTLSRYQDSGYYEVNRALRAGVLHPGSSEALQVQYLDDALSKAAAPAPLTLHRGLDWAERRGLSGLKPGDIFLDEGYVSTSLSSKQAQEFANANMQMIIRLPEGSNALYLDGLDSNHYAEAEVLLPRGSQFKVLSRKVEGRKVILEVAVL